MTNTATTTATNATEHDTKIGITPRPRFVRASYDEADRILFDELGPLGDAANNYGWYGPHGYKDLPDLIEDLHNRRNVLGAALHIMRDAPERESYIVGTGTFTYPMSDLAAAQREEGVRCIYFVQRLNGELRFTEVA